MSEIKNGRTSRIGRCTQGGFSKVAVILTTAAVAALILVGGATYAKRPQSAQSSKVATPPDWSMGNLADQGRPDPATQLHPTTPQEQRAHEHEWWRLGDDNDYLVTPEANYLRWPLPAGEEKYADVKGEDVKRRELEVVAISEQSRKDGNQLWGRIAGTKYDHMSSEWVQAQLKKDPGMEVHVQPQDLPTEWMPTSWQASVSFGGKSYNVTSAMPIPNSVGTTGPVESDVVWVGDGWKADFKGRDLKGKVALMYSAVTPGGEDSVRIWADGLKRAADAGAVLAVEILGVPGNATNFHGTPAPGVPSIVISDDEGLAIREALEKDQPVKFKLNLKVEQLKGLKTETTWGVLPGMSDEKIIFLAHHDAYFDGAMDNASGMAMMQYIAARYAAMPKEQRKRTMVFMDTPLHHSFTVENGGGNGVGAKWLHDNVDKLFPNTVMAINCEHITETQFDNLGAGVMSTNTTVGHPFFVDGSDDFKNLVMSTFREFGVAVYRLREPSPGGELGQTQFFKMFPSFHVIDREFYHTSNDTPDWTPANGEESTTRAYLKIIDTVESWPTSKLWGNFKSTDQKMTGN